MSIFEYTSMDEINGLLEYHGKERKIMKNNNDTNCFYSNEIQTKKLIKKRSQNMIRTYHNDGNDLFHQNNYNYNSITSCEPFVTHKLIRCSNFRQNSEENTYPLDNCGYKSKFSSFRIEPKIIYDETWLSNKQYNARVTAYKENKKDKTLDTNDKLRSKQKSSRTCTYQASTGQVVHERFYPGTHSTKLRLRVAVNGASKSMRGHLPLSNLNLVNGDFGDDAGMFVENHDYSYVGLADGAGGNRSLGLNPADFSRAILAACRNLLQQSNIQPTQLPRLIVSAMQQVEASRIQGSSTLCLLALNKQEHKLTSLNIGDSGFVIYRNNEIYRRSKCTMNSNGFGPRQLFALNSSLGFPCFTNENEILRDCSLDTVEVQQNDIIILSSDGLWDVIQSNELQEIVERNTNKHLQDLADDLLSQAVEGYIANGRDDILVIVCRVDST